MKRAILFEKDGGYLHKCMFAGLDNEGNAQWVMTDQGDEMMTLSQYRKYNLLDDDEMLLLCMEGEKVESKTMSMFLGAVIRGYRFNTSFLSERIETLRRWGISWRREPLRMTVSVMGYWDDDRGCQCYRFYILEENLGVVADADNFDSVDALMDFVFEYFSVLEFEAAVTVTSKRLDADSEVLETMRKEDLRMFDNVDLLLAK